MKRAGRLARRAVAIAVLTSIYGSTWLISRILGRRGPAMTQTGRVLVIATFHNPRWFHSHIEPLLHSGIHEIILVCDEPIALVHGVRYACPPAWVSRILGRALAKFLWAVVYGIRVRPDLYMGYHILPAGVSALILGRLFNRPASYQLTSGQAQLAGGGWQAENALLNALGSASSLIEKLAFAVTREFDLVVVRGNRAKAFVEHTGYRRRLAVITAGIKRPEEQYAFNDRDIDLAFLGRIIRDKRPEHFVSVVAHVARIIPQVRTVVIGDGPELAKTQRLAVELGIKDRVVFMGKRSDVLKLMARTKVFVLPSRWEGVSIAMLEAMTAGAVPIVADVGDQRDVIENGVDGYLIAQDADDAFGVRAVELLSQPSVWAARSRAAAQKARICCGIDVIAQRWREALKGFVATQSAEGKDAGWSEG